VADFVFGLRAILMIASVIIFVSVFAAMFLSVCKRHRSGVGSHTNFHESVALEICWALVPCVIVVLLVWPAARIFWVS
jgi:cytochrome c oxidase subunit 2